MDLGESYDMIHMVGGKGQVWIDGIIITLAYHPSLAVV